MGTQMPHIFFFETFQEEEQALRRYLPKFIRPTFTRKTIQASQLKQPPAKILAIRTQSHIPSPWLPQLSGILTRSSGYDHLWPVREQVPCGYLPNYCARAVAEQAFLLALALLRRLPLQIKKFGAFNRDGLTGEEI